MSKKTKIVEASENIFADLGIERPAEYLQKADLAAKIIDVIRQKGLTQAKAAAVLGIDQPKISQLNRGLLDGFSLERLMKFLEILDRPHVIVPIHSKSVIRLRVKARGRRRTIPSKIPFSDTYRVGFSSTKDSKMDFAGNGFLQEIA